MYVQVYHPSQRIQRRMFLPHERLQVNDLGLGGLDGFNVGKMFKRMFTFKPSSFTFKNIMGSIGSGVTNFMTLGAASAFAPKTFSAHSTAMRQVGMGVSAAALAAGAVVAAPAIGSALSPVLSAAKSMGSNLLSMGGKLFGGGGSSSGSGGSTSSGGGFLDTAGKVLETGARVVAATTTPQQPFGLYDSSGIMFAPQPIVTDQQYPQITGVAQNVPDGWYQPVQNQALMYAGQAGVGQMPGGPGMNGGYYDAGSGPVDQGVIVNADGTVEQADIISGVPNKYVYIGGGAIALWALYMMSN